ncbi:MAG: hypothetical protein ACRBN8_19830 [Nannocystales bacterium]
MKSTTITTHDNGSVSIFSATDTGFSAGGCRDEIQAALSLVGHSRRVDLITRAVSVLVDDEPSAKHVTDAVVDAVAEALRSAEQRAADWDREHGGGLL